MGQAFSWLLNGVKGLTVKELTEPQSLDCACVAQSKDCGSDFTNQN